MSNGFRHLGVPYFSQWADPAHARRIVEERVDPCLDPSWSETGFEDEASYRFWARRICGLACLRSVLTHWQRRSPTPRELLRGALAVGAFVQHPDGRVDGLVYAPFARWVEARFGLGVEVLPRVAPEVLAAAIGPAAMAIASVSSEIRWPERPNARRGGHLVLLHGSDAGGVWFHNPSGATGTQCDARLEFDQFARFFAGRGMVVRRPPPFPPPPGDTP